MGSTAVWISVAIVLFVLGSLFGLRVNPREKALGQLREQVRKQGMTPRLLAMPDWVRASGPLARDHHGLVAFYHVLVPQGALPLVQASVVDGRLQVQHGPMDWQGQGLNWPGAYAVEQQANSIGVYWNEQPHTDPAQLADGQAQLQALAQQFGASFS